MKKDCKKKKRIDLMLNHQYVRDLYFIYDTSYMIRFRNNCYTKLRTLSYYCVRMILNDVLYDSKTEETLRSYLNILLYFTTLVLLLRI